MKKESLRFVLAFGFLGLFLGVVGCGGRSFAGRSGEPIDKLLQEERYPANKTIPPDISDAEFAYLKERQPEAPASTQAGTASWSKENMLKTTVTTVNNDEHAAPNQIGETNQRVHVVAKGETLWSLGRRYGVAWTEILAVNEALNPNRISIGTKLVIPQSGKMN